MSKKVSMRTNKDVILSYVEELEKELEEAKAAKFDPEKKKEEIKKANTEKKAKEIIGLNILNETIVDQYNSVIEDINNKKEELKTLYGIEVNANTLAALIEAADLEKIKLQMCLKAI